MGRRIKVTVGEVEIYGELNETVTADLIWKGLPIESRINTWGDEIYFSIPIQAQLEDSAREVVELGDMGYWPPGNAFCVFFGPTPNSRGNEIRPASPVNVFGKVIGDPKVLKTVRTGTSVRVEEGD
ncbi:MAG: hypothetical protein GTO13_09735 [Proteobacteria bacterium]|nr:hypothetical protein [Pseudomonadota bacterium]